MIEPRHSRKQSPINRSNPWIRECSYPYNISNYQADFFAGLTGPDDEIFDDIGERVSAMRRPGEDEMAFYERRYQERVRL